MDFSEKPQVDISSIAGVLQRKAAQQAQMDQQGQQQRMQMIQQAVQGATQTVTGMIQASKDRQKNDFIKSLGDAMAAQVPQQNVTLPQQGPSLPDNSNQIPSATVPGDVSDRTSQFMPGTPGQVGTSQPGLQALPPVQTQVPDVNKQNAIRAAVALNPDQASQDVLKANTPNTGAASGWETKATVNADGTIGYVDHNKLTGETRAVQGVQGTGVTPAQRQAGISTAQENADTRQQNANTNQSRFVSVMGNKFADSQDPTKLRDYDRLTAGKRLDQFVKSTQGEATGQQVKEASSLLASMLQGGGRGGVVSEKLIDQLTPTTLKGNAKMKLQWLTNHPESVDQGEFINLFQKTALREAQAGEDNIRQQQVEGIQKYGKKVKSLDPQRYQQIMAGTGLTEDNIDPQGRFIRTPTTRSILPNYNDHTAANQGAKGIDLGGGFSYSVK